MKGLYNIISQIFLNDHCISGPEDTKCKNISSKYLESSYMFCDKAQWGIAFQARYPGGGELII